MKVSTPFGQSLVPFYWVGTFLLSTLSACEPQATDPGYTAPTPTVTPGVDQDTPTATPEVEGPTPTLKPDQTPYPTPTEGPDTTPPPENTPIPGALTGFYVAGSFPQDGAMAVPGMMLTQIFFSEPFVGDLGTIHVSITGRSGTTVTLDEPIESPDGLSVGYPTELWSNDFSYTLKVEIEENEFLDADWPLTYEAKFQTGGIPCDLTFDLYPELNIVTLGGAADPNATPVPEITPEPEPDATPTPTPEPTPPPDNRELLALLNAMLDNSGADYPTAMFLKGIPQNIDFPEKDPVTGFSAPLASVYQTPEGTYEIYGDTGISSQLNTCSLDKNGLLTCTDERAAFPLRLYATVQLYLYIQDAHAEGRLESSGNVTDMSDFFLEGYMLATDLFNLLNAVGYGYLAEKIVLDVDSDGDGLPDAASIRLESQPNVIYMEACGG